MCAQNIKNIKNIQNKYTVITALFDIEREKWSLCARTISSYIHFLKNVLSLKAPIVIFCEEKFIPTVIQVRKNSLFDTTIVPTKITELYMYKYKDLLFDIQKDENYGKNHPNPRCPEIGEPMYSLIVSNKLDFLCKGIQYAKTDYCIWLDAGYTHSTIDISKIDWNPTSLYEIKDKISIISLRPMTDMISADPLDFSNQFIDIINGGFFGGHKHTIDKVHKLYYSIIDEMLTKYRIKEDDQFYWTIFAYRHAELINLIPGNWYDAFKIQ